MERPAHPLLVWLRTKFGDHPNYEAVAAWFVVETAREVTADSLRLIAQGQRRPSGDLALDIETATKKKVTARELLEWPHYVRHAKRAA